MVGQNTNLEIIALISLSNDRHCIEIVLVFFGFFLGGEGVKLAQTTPTDPKFYLRRKNYVGSAFALTRIAEDFGWGRLSTCCGRWDFQIQDL